MLYLLLVSALFVGAAILGAIVVVEYGLVVFVAACAAGIALSVVAAVVVSVVTGDKKLMKAQSRIKRWHIMCKDEILKEIDKLREDYSAYVAGDVLLLTYDDGADAKGRAAGGATDEDGSPDGRAVSEGAKKSRVHRPRSLLFRAVAEFNPFARSSGNRGPSTSKIDGVDRRRATMPSWKRKKKGNIDNHHAGEAAGYDPPAIV
ncbi:hypothetical protein ACHAW5_005481 [Stephanodiscus triporus]|uniref:Uncharacterized protein n=1 Tax=Stephanodiscus triporus TaxID=2934178 RepID=A0ABD3PRS3_9STRA